MILIKEVEEKNLWEGFNLKSSKPTFLQSWTWGDFQRNLGKDFYRLGIYEDNNLVGISLIICQKAKLASFLYCPGGPVFSDWNKDYLKHWLFKASEIAKEKKVSFLRVDPRKLEESQLEILSSFGFVKAPEYTQPPCTAILDLTASEEELRSRLSDSTRYNLNAAERRGVIVREGRESEIKNFVDFLKSTATKKTLVLPIEKNYHEKQFETLRGAGLMKLFIAGYQGEPLAASLVVFYGDTAYYLHAANSYNQPKLRASYPLVWHTIMESKRLGLKWFDFWGAAATDSPKDPWAGVTAFKLSFGAERECYERPYDLPYGGSYQVIRFVEILRRPLRRTARLFSRLAKNN